jgi:hypothetical protein
MASCKRLRLFPGCMLQRRMSRFDHQNALPPVPHIKNDPGILSFTEPHAGFPVVHGKGPQNEPAFNRRDVTTAQIPVAPQAWQIVLAL